MFPPSQKNNLFWLAVAAAGGGISGFLIVVVSLCVLLALCLAVFVQVDGKSSNISPSTDGNSSLLLTNVSHNWTGQSTQAVNNEALHSTAAL